VHTAVKIAPNYTGRSCTCSTPRARRSSQGRRAEYETRARARGGGKEKVPRDPIGEARANGSHRLGAYRRRSPLHRPAVFADYPLAELVARIDWTPFFRAWELAGKLSRDPRGRGGRRGARNLFADAQAMLERSSTRSG
jgi:5-methyltetrahydrofolate--homocysteine methyltransferase